MRFVLNSRYDADPQRYDLLRQCWLNQRRFLFLCQVIEKQGHIENVIEVGSGTGRLLDSLAAAFPATAFWGVEPLAAYVEFSRRRARAPNVVFREGSAETVHLLGLPKADAVLSNDVLHHLSRMEDAVRSVTGTAAPGCRWHAIEPNWLNPYSALRQCLLPGERLFLPWRFTAAMAVCGWTRLSARRLFAVPPFVRSAGPMLQALERAAERIPPLAGGVYQGFALEAQLGSFSASTSEVSPQNSTPRRETSSRASEAILCGSPRPGFGPGRSAARALFAS